jgi:hypothetical protein
MLLSDIKDKIVDLNRSKWDKENSEPGRGFYIFTEKVYLKKSDYNDATSRPAYYLKFVDYCDGENTDNFKSYVMNYEASPVTTSDPYWPEPLSPNAEDRYVFKDTILVKIPFALWLEKKLKDKKEAARGGEISKQGFRNVVGSNHIEASRETSELI